MARQRIDQWIGQRPWSPVRVRRCWRSLLAVTLVLLLTGCGLAAPKPPTAAVEAALMQQITQTQTLLHANLGATDAPLSQYQVGRVKIQHQQSLTLDHHPAVEVRGTYTLKGDRLSRSQRQQSRPFTLYLTQSSDQTNWTLIQPAPTLADS